MPNYTRMARFFTVNKEVKKRSYGLGNELETLRKLMYKQKIYYTQ